MKLILFLALLAISLPMSGQVTLSRDSIDKVWPNHEKDLIEICNSIKGQLETEGFLQRKELPRYKIEEKLYDLADTDYNDPDKLKKVNFWLGRHHGFLRLCNCASDSYATPVDLFTFILIDGLNSEFYYFIDTFVEDFRIDLSNVTDTDSDSKVIDGTALDYLDYEISLLEKEANRQEGKVDKYNYYRQYLVDHGAKTAEEHEYFNRWAALCMAPSMMLESSEYNATKMPPRYDTTKKLIEYSGTSYKDKGKNDSIKKWMNSIKDECYCGTVDEDDSPGSHFLIQLVHHAFISEFYYFLDNMVEDVGIDINYVGLFTDHKTEEGGSKTVGTPLDYVNMEIQYLTAEDEELWEDEIEGWNYLKNYLIEHGARTLSQLEEDGLNPLFIWHEVEIKDSEFTGNFFWKYTDDSLLIFNLSYNNDLTWRTANFDLKVSLLNEKGEVIDENRANGLSIREGWHEVIIEGDTNKVKDPQDITGFVKPLMPISKRTELVFPAQVKVELLGLKIDDSEAKKRIKDEKEWQENHK